MAASSSGQTKVGVVEPNCRSAVSLSVSLLACLLTTSPNSPQDQPPFGDTGTPGSIQAFAVGENASVAVVADYDGNLLLLDLNSGQMRILIRDYPYAINELVISPKLDFVSFAHLGEIVRVCLMDPEHQLQTIEVEPEAQIGGVSISPDGKSLAGASGSLSAVLVWDVLTGAETRRFVGCTGGQQFTAFSHDGSHLAAVCDESTVRIWDLSTSRHLHDLTLGRDAWVNWIRFSKDGRWVMAATGGTNTIEVFDSSSGEVVCTLNGHTKQVESFLLQKDNLLVSSADDQTVRVWDVETCKLLKTLPIPAGKIGGDGSLVLSEGTEPPLLDLWDVRTGTKIKTFYAWADGSAESPK